MTCGPARHVGQPVRRVALPDVRPDDSPLWWDFEVVLANKEGHRRGETPFWQAMRREKLPMLFSSAPAEAFLIGRGNTPHKALTSLLLLEAEAMERLEQAGKKSG